MQINGIFINPEQVDCNKKGVTLVYWHVKVVQGHVSVDDCLLLQHSLSFRQKYSNKNFTQNWNNNDFLFIDKGFQINSLQFENDLTSQLTISFFYAFF